jgi:hypothetical protein
MAALSSVKSKLSPSGGALEGYVELDLIIVLCRHYISVSIDYAFCPFTIDSSFIYSLPKRQSMFCPIC